MFLDFTNILGVLIEPLEICRFLVAYHIYSNIFDLEMLLHGVFPLFAPRDKEGRGGSALQSDGAPWQGRTLGWDWRD